MKLGHIKKTVYSKLNYRLENYIEVVDKKSVSKEQFDTILCLGTVKWIHLCFGDVGLKALFLKAYAQLAVGGYFIFEQQPWKSYKKTKHFKPEFKDFLKGDGVKIRPDEFTAYLKTIGFQLEDTLKAGAGIDKPI